MGETYWQGVRNLLLHDDSGLHDPKLREEAEVECKRWAEGEYAKEPAANAKALRRMQEIMNQYQKELHERLEELSVGEQPEGTGEGTGEEKTTQVTCNPFLFGFGYFQVPLSRL